VSTEHKSLSDLHLQVERQKRHKHDPDQLTFDLRTEDAVNSGTTLQLNHSREDQ
jgi:hypothetical protein